MRSNWGLSRGFGGLYGLLLLAFLVVGAVLLLLGFDLDAVDRWLDARTDWFDLIGTILFKAVLAIVLACCVFIASKGVFDRLPLPGRRLRHKKHRVARSVGERRMPGSRGASGRPESGELPPGAAGGDKPMGWAAVIAAIIIGYFAYVGLVN